MKNKFPRALYFLLCFMLIFEQSGFAQVAGQLDISGYFNQLRNVLVQDRFRPLHLRYLAYDSANNSFKAVLDKGDVQLQQPREIEGLTRQLLNYFLVGISLPNSSFWVNLRPDSPDNVIDSNLAQTDLGKVLLEADLQLKKDTADFTSPQTPEGRDYWNKLYQKANELFPGENVSIPTLTRPWIVPGEIIIRQTQENAYIYKASLKVMLEQDYLKDSAAYSFSDERLKRLNEYASELIRKEIIPKLTKDVNAAKRYAPLRQVYYSLILAQWFKQGFSGKSGPYSQLIDRGNLSGLTSKEAWSKDAYFQAYKKSFQEGEYNIKEPVYTHQGKVIRSYMSGGISLGPEIIASIQRDQITAIKALPGELISNNIAVDYSVEGIKITNMPESKEIAKVESVINQVSQEPPVLQSNQEQGESLSSSPLPALSKAVFSLAVFIALNSPALLGQTKNTSIAKDRDGLVLVEEKEGTGTILSWNIGIEKPSEYQLRQILATRDRIANEARQENFPDIIKLLQFINNAIDSNFSAGQNTVYLKDAFPEAEGKKARGTFDCDSRAIMTMAVLEKLGYSNNSVSMSTLEGHMVLWVKEKNRFLELTTNEIRELSAAERLQLNEISNLNTYLSFLLSNEATNLALASGRSQEKQEATIKKFDESIKLDPGNITAHLNYIYMLERRLTGLDQQEIDATWAIDRDGEKPGILQEIKEERQSVISQAKEVYRGLFASLAKKYKELTQPVLIGVSGNNPEAPGLNNKPGAVSLGGEQDPYAAYLAEKFDKYASFLYFKAEDYAGAMEAWQSVLDKAGNSLDEINKNGVKIYITKAMFRAGKYAQFIKEAPGFISGISKFTIFQRDADELTAMLLAARIISGEIKINEGNAQDFCKRYGGDPFIGPFVNGEERWNMRYINVVETLKAWDGFKQMMESIKKAKEGLIDPAQPQNNGKNDSGSSRLPPAGGSIGPSSSPVTFDPGQGGTDKDSARLIEEMIRQASGMIKTKKDYISKWVTAIGRLPRLPVSGETRPVERFFALLSGVAGAVKKATGYNDYDTLIYPCSGPDISGALSFFDLEDVSVQRKYNVVTIDRSNILAGMPNQGDLEREIGEYVAAKLGSGISFGPYRQYLTDYLLDLALLARRFDPQGNNLGALFDSLRVIGYKKQDGAIMTTVSFIINGHTIEHTHIAYFLGDKFNENKEGDVFVKGFLEQIIAQADRTVMISKAHAILMAGQDTSTEAIYPLLKSGTVVVSDDQFERKKLSLSKTKGELVDLKTAEVVNDLARMQEGGSSSTNALSNLYWGYAKNLAGQLQIFKFNRKIELKDIIVKFNSGIGPNLDEELFIIEKCKEFNLRLKDLKEPGLNDQRELGIDAIVISLLEEFGADPLKTNAPVAFNEAYRVKATIFKDLRHDLKHVLTPLEFAFSLSYEVNDFKDYNAALSGYPDLILEDMMLVRLLGWEGLFNADAEVLVKIYDRILRHINRALRFKLAVDKLAAEDNLQDENSIHHAYLKSSKAVEQEIRLFIATFDRLKNEVNSPGIKKPMDINASVAETFNAYSMNYTGYKYDLRLDDKVSSLEVSANALQLSCAWKNLITNAWDAAGSNGEITVTSGVVEKDGKQFARVTFTDSGKPIPQEMLAERKLFQEGVSSKFKGGGTGLYLVDQIIQYHNGSIEAYSGESGPKFVIDLPITGPSASSPVNKSVQDISNKLRPRLQSLPQDFRKEVTANILVDEIINELDISREPVYINKSAAELFSEIALDSRDIKESRATRSRIEQFRRWFEQELEELNSLVKQGLSADALSGYSDAEKEAISAVFKRIGALVNYSSSSSPLAERDFSIHVVALEVLLDFVRHSNMNIDADKLISGKILNIGLETNSFTEKLVNENITTYLASQGKDVTGLDPHPDLAGRFTGGGKFVSGWAQKMPFSDNTFDTVISIGLFNPEMFDLEEMQKQGASTLDDFYSQSAREIRRVLKDRAVALISTGPAMDSASFVKAFTSAGFDVNILPCNGFVLFNNKTVNPAPSSGSSSSAVADARGGIDFRALPIAAQNPASPLPGNIPASGSPAIIDLDQSLVQIQDMLKAGIIPSSQRIKEYLQHCYMDKGAEREKGGILACIAGIFRLQEEQVINADPSLKEMLALLESNKPADEAELILTGITVAQGEPIVIAQ